jgi:glycine/D-amino acid oxidase-like deaminating enzyme
MDLHTGCPIWLLGNVPAIQPPPLERDARCEVAVVGAGVTGALLVDRLTRAGCDTVLVDSRTFGVGSTAASTSLLICEPDTHLFELEEQFGGPAVKRVYALGVQAIEQLEALAVGLPGSCGFARRSCLYLASDDAGAALLEREHAARRRLGIPCERLSKADLHGAGYSCSAPLALRSAVAGEMNAYQLALALIEGAMTHGLRAYSATRIVGLHRGRTRQVSLQTDRGRTIRADAVVFASGYEAHEQLDERLGSLSSTWAFASDPVASFDGWPDRALIWETARPYVYLRTTSEGRVLMGGGDEPYARSHQDEAKIGDKVRRLAERFTRMFPAIPLRRVQAWAGVFGSSQDGLPYIGRPDPHRPVYYALGYGGNGITFSAIAAEIIAEELQGRRHPDAELFRFGR